jgi:hypothetical protein
MTAEEESKRKRKCLYHPAMNCPTPEKTCIFLKIEKANNHEHNEPT